MKKLIITLISIFINIAIFAQDSKLLIDSCEIKIPIGTRFMISGELHGIKISGFKLLNQSKVEKPIDMMKVLKNYEKKDIVSNELEFKFCYADFMGSKMVVLTTLHHLEKSITFKAKIKIKGRKDFVETSIMAIFPNAYGIEQWHDDIESIILYDFIVNEEKN